MGSHGLWALMSLSTVLLETPPQPQATGAQSQGTSRLLGPGCVSLQGQVRHQRGNHHGAMERFCVVVALFYFCGEGSLGSGGGRGKKGKSYCLITAHTPHTHTHSTAPVTVRGQPGEGGTPGGSMVSLFSLRADPFSEAGVVSAATPCHREGRPSSTLTLTSLGTLDK